MERLSNELLVDAVVIQVCGVKQRHAQVESPVEDALCPGPVQSQGHAPQAHDGHLNAGFPQTAIPHRVPLYRVPVGQVISIFPGREDERNENESGCPF